MDPSVGHLNGILARVGGNLNNNFQKSQMPGGLPGGGMLKLRFDQYISVGTLLFLTQTFVGAWVTLAAALVCLFLSIFHRKFLTKILNTFFFAYFVFI